MEDDIRKPDNIIREQLIDNPKYIESDDEEINKALQESIKTAQEEYISNKNIQKYEAQINNLKMINDEEIRLLKYKQDNLKKKQIEERELLMRPVIMFLNRLKLKDLITIINIYIETGKQIEKQYYYMFKKELKPSIFNIIEPLFIEEMNYDSGDDYYYND